MEENRVLQRQLGQQRIQLTDADRRRQAVRGCRLGRQVLLQIATIVTQTRFAVASAAYCAEVDLSEQARRPPQCPRRDSPPGRADGGRESYLGLHTDPGAFPRGTESPRSSRSADCDQNASHRRVLTVPSVAASDLVGSSVTIIEPRDGSIEFSDSPALGYREEEPPACSPRIHAAMVFQSSSSWDLNCLPPWCVSAMPPASGASGMISNMLVSGLPGVTNLETTLKLARDCCSVQELAPSASRSREKSLPL